MKNIGCALAMWLAVGGSLSAQVNVEVLMDQDQFLPDESIPVKTRVSNNSGQTLNFGKEDWLTYSVENRNGFIVVRNGDMPCAHNFDVKPSEWAATHADLAPYFEITKPGRYAVTATVSIADWGKTVSSPPAYFDVVSGTKLWEQEFGVPQSSTNHSQPEVRKYILMQATLTKRMKLYLKLTDATESRTYRVFAVGPMISFANPQMLVDQSSNLHLFYQETAHVYSYSVINPDAEMTVRQTYDYAGSVPHLRVDEKGNPIIVGGVRHITPKDLPPPARKSFLTNDIPPPLH